jgi:hypothetical protein
MINKKVFLPVLNKIGYKSRKKLSLFLNIKNVSDAFNCENISKQRFDQLNEFLELQKTQNFSFISPPVNCDTIQLNGYYIRLNDYINSPCFQKLKHKDQGRVIIEQININKQINK